MNRGFCRALGVLLALFVFAEQSANTQGLVRNGRWFNYNGATPYIVGVDSAQLAFDANYTAKLDNLTQNGINKVRIWLYHYYQPQLPAPWGQDAAGKFNLDTWNASYWTQVRTFVSAARARGVIVEVSIFGPNNLRDSLRFIGNCGGPPPVPEKPEQFSNAWNRFCNVNGVFDANSVTTLVPEFFDLNVSATSTTGKLLRDYQQALVDKAVDELASFDNVYFEVVNEFPLNDVSGQCPAQPANCGTYDVEIPGLACASDIDHVQWHQNWLNRINQRTPRLVTAHSQQGWGANTTGICHYWGMSAVDVLNFHFYTYNPGTISGLLNGAQRKGKILQNNESGAYLNSSGTSLNPTALNRNTRLAWSMLLSGGYFGLYLDQPAQIGGTGWTEASQRMRSLRAIADAAQFHQLSPVRSDGTEYDNLVSQGPTASNWQVMAQPGSRYLAYFWCNDSQAGCPSGSSVRINLDPGSYAYRFYNVVTGAVLASGTVNGGGVRTLVPPGTAAWTAAAGLALTIEPLGATLAGFHDVLTCTAAIGWAWDSTLPNTPINVDLFDGAALLATVSANGFRQDLLDAGIGNGFHGFGYSLPSSVRDGASHTITARFGGTSIPLSGSPKTIQCPAVRLIWLQPQALAGFGPPGSLVMAGSALGGPAGSTVQMRWRDVTTGGPWVTESFQPTPDTNGIWFHSVPNVNTSHLYDVTGTYAGVTSATCQYPGTGGFFSCP